MRKGSIVGRPILLGILLFALASPGWAQKSEPRPQPLDPAQGEKEARSLVGDLLSRKPEQNATNTGVLKIRDSDDKKREVPVRFEVFANASDWVSVYETTPTGGADKERLVVTHAQGQPNRYQLATGSDSKSLGGAEAHVPFAGSDFLATDLGLEFLHWPKQRVLRKEMRRSQFCNVLESTNPDAAGYRRVVAWIDAESGAIVHADAYDQRNDVVKEFDPTELKKINGQYQLEEMEIRNRKTGSHTWVKFNLKAASNRP
jgi:hypothetical protein